jgi:hypothetical protein
MTTIRPSELKGRCYAERGAPQLSVAICLDLDPAAQGETVDEAKGKLDAIIDDGVCESWDGTDQAYTDAMLNRRAPQSYWLRFRSFAVRRRIRRHDDTPRPFNEPLPLVVTP